MDYDEESNLGFVTATADDESQSAVNSLILDYYKKFGRKRDLEQYFSLSTAQTDLRDPTGTFWRKMKSENDSSDSGDKKSESSQEVCRISIRCSLPEPCTSQEEDSKSKTESVSPPIIIEEVPNESRPCSEDESAKSDDNDNHSQKSYDVTMDTSINKPLSPSSSITSQRKLEWDSLADVGYANESDRKTSASSLSTLERLALKQQYSNNDTNDNIKVGPPTSHSTPLDEQETRSKIKKGIGKKTTKIIKKDIDLVEVNVPHCSDNNPPQSISVNLTKHISFNVEKDGKITIENTQKDVSVSPEKVSREAETSPKVSIDKEIQTSLVKNREPKSSPDSIKNVQAQAQKIPVLISLNTLRKRVRRNKLMKARRKLKSRKRAVKESIIQEKSEQLSEAESFEYMPGHIYNQNQLQSASRSNMVGNKSSLESSGALTTDSSKGSKHSFTKDFEKSIDMLRSTLQERCNDSNIRKQLIKQVCQRLLKSKYRDDDSSSDFLSGLSSSSKKLSGQNTTTSTSDANVSESTKIPKKSILRNDKFNSGDIASTSQSAPNLPIATNSDKPVTSNLTRLSSNTDSEHSSKEKTSSDNVFAKTSSEELYKKYLEALKREQAYKKHLKDKEMFLKQKLVCSDSAFNIPPKSDPKINNRLRDLIKDLTRNNYDDGSGDASKLEGGPNSNTDFERFIPIKTQRSHSVFTMSSGNSDYQQKKSNLKKRLQCGIKDFTKPSTSKDMHYCCCPHHASNVKVGVADSSVQVNIKVPCSGDSSLEKSPKRNLSPRSCSRAASPTSPRNMSKNSAKNSSDVKYVCLCNNKVVQDVPDNFVVYKCPRQLNKEMQLEETSKLSDTSSKQYKNQCTACNNDAKVPTTSKACNSNKSSIEKDQKCCDKVYEIKKSSKSSQTNMLIQMLSRRSSDRSTPSSEEKFAQDKDEKCCDHNCPSSKSTNKIYEATRCIQTEISINPKISEPTLSDINIVSNNSCAKLINECCREVSIPTTNIYRRQSQGDHGSESTKSTGTSKDIEEIRDQFTEDNFTEPMAQPIQKEAVNNAKDNAENFAIPIQGTNMTLMVTIGSNDRQVNVNPKTDNNNMVPENVGTEKVGIAEQYTSITEECSKAVQYRNTESNLNREELIDHNRNTCNLNQNTEKHNDLSKNTNTVNSCSITEGPKFNTYPKSPVFERKPLLRTNTDTNNLERCIDFLNKKDNKSNSSSISSQKSIGSKCVCGCSVKNCDNKCVETNILTKDAIDSRHSSIPKSESSKKSENGCQPDNKIITEQMSKISQKCQCGCSHEEGDCKESCTNGSTVSPKNKEVGTQKDSPVETTKSPRNQIIVKAKSSSPTDTSSGVKSTDEKEQESNGGSCSKKQNNDKINNNIKQTQNKIPSSSDSDQLYSDPIIEMIQSITKRYSKTDVDKNKRKRCFKEIMNLLSYLLETDESADRNDKEIRSCESTPSPVSDNSQKRNQDKIPCQKSPKKVDKAVQLSSKKPKAKCCSNTESSDLPISSDIPGTSTDSATCKVLNKIKKECERYHQKRCKHSGKKCESSSTSVNCEHCRRIHYCHCRTHKCKNKKPCAEKVPKKPVAYNLIIQTSESMISEDTTCQTKCLKNIVVKVPPKKKQFENVPFKEMEAKIERKMPECLKDAKGRSRSCPNETEISSLEEIIRRTEACTVREYLERNRPDFVENCSQRQNCLKFVSGSRVEEPRSQMRMVVVHTPKCSMYGGVHQMSCGNQYCDPCVQNEVTRIASDRATKRDLLSMRLAQLSNVRDLAPEQLRRLARDIGRHVRDRQPAPKLISEREMKRHSEKIYKSLPEVVQKKVDLKKENEKKTNLLMASLFKKNLQKKTLRGSVNLSNYSPVISI